MWRMILYYKVLLILWFCNTSNYIYNNTIKYPKYHLKDVYNTMVFMSGDFPLGDLTNNKYINNVKTVLKPWGKEIWLALNDKYCYKRIEIHAGFKTSYQIHNFKLETNYIIKGDAEVWLENDDGIVEKFFMKEGDFFTVIPTRKHRVIAITDVILQEVSTPEVDDVIRINDEFNRSDGKIEAEHMVPVVCIIAAGTGSRLGNISNTCHKTLLPIKHKAIISHIIDKFNKNIEIIIGVGYLKDQLKEYIHLYHQDRKITFVDIEPYEGEGSGPAFSLQCCRKELQRPFYFCVSDFITETGLENVTFSTNNWIGLSPTTTPELYSTVKITDNVAEKLVNKTPDGFSEAFTGIFYMYDYSTFWRQFDLHVNTSQELVDAFKDIGVFNFQIKNIDWQDTGTRELYEQVVERNDGKNLYLHNTKHEYKYKHGDVFIKKIDNVDKINNLFIRQRYLEKYTPKMLFQGKYFISYEFFQGDTLYALNDREVYLRYLKWFEDNFIGEQIPKTQDMKDVSNKFYKEKTMMRLGLFQNKYENFSALDSITLINGNKTETIQYYLDKVDWENLLDIIPTRLCHGDLQFDNIVYNGDEFKLIDWREDFGGNTEYGDLYYDLAKLFGGMVLNYARMKDPTSYLWKRLDETRITLEHYVDYTLLGIAKNEFADLLKRYNFDFNRVKTLTAIIFLNMAPLHVNDFDTFLFFISKALFSEVI